MKVQDARKRAGLTQKELSAAIDLSLRTLQQYEIGPKIVDNARLDTILKICIELDCNIEDIMEGPELLALLKEYEDRKSARK